MLANAGFARGAGVARPRRDDERRVQEVGVVVVVRHIQRSCGCADERRKASNRELLLIAGAVLAVEEQDTLVVVGAVAGAASPRDVAVVVLILTKPNQGRLWSGRPPCALKVLREGAGARDLPLTCRGRALCDHATDIDASREGVLAVVRRGPASARVNDLKVQRACVCASVGVTRDRRKRARQPDRAMSWLSQ